MSDFNLDMLRKELKDEIIILDNTFDFFLTGNPLFDAFIGSGGLPKYQMQYLWGKNSIGKSTLALQILASYQKQHGDNCVCLYFDKEESLTKSRLIQMGVDCDKVIIIVPEYIEKVSEIINRIHSKYKKNKLDLFVIWDTLIMTPSKEEVEGYEKIGSQARAMSSLFRLLEFYELNLTMLSLNQHRETIDKFATKEPPSGNAAKHKSFLTINGVSKKSDIWSDTKDIGRASTLNTVKSKIISPHRKMVFEYTYVYGYDAILTAIRYMWKELKILEKSKGTFHFVNQKDNKMSINKLYKFMMTDESVLKWKIIIEAIYENLYKYDEPTFVQEAQKRIFDYYFPNDTIKISAFTSINKSFIDEDLINEDDVIDTDNDEEDYDFGNDLNDIEV